MNTHARRRVFIALLAVVLVDGLLALLLLVQLASGRASLPTPFPLAPSSMRTETMAPTATPTLVLSPTPTPTRITAEWEWAKPGFAGGDAITLTRGIEQYVYYNWLPVCDAPARRHIPMMWGRKSFADPVTLERLFDGPCNDGRPLLFLNEPAKVEQANIRPAIAARLFYAMTRGPNWPYERWRGPIYAGNNVVEERHWDAEFVREFAKLTGGSAAIPEIAGWGIHVYGNYQYGPQRGDPNVVWTGHIPPAQIRPVVYRSMREVDGYIAERRAEGNATALIVTEFGLLQASQWHKPPRRYYDMTARFMDEFVRQFDRLPEIQAWFWFLSAGSGDDFLDTNLAVDAQGALTPNGVRWRELARARQQR